METINKEQEKKADTQTTNQTSGQTEKKPKSYKWVAIVLGMLLVVVLMFECGGCYSNYASRWDLYNNTERRVVTYLDESIENAMVEKETIDGIKVDETKMQKMDSIGLYRKGKKWGYYNLNSRKMITKEGDGYDYVWFFSDGLAAVVKDDKIGFVDMKGNLVIPYQYLYRTNKSTSPAFKNGYCKMAGRDGRYGVINKKGQWVIKPVYENLSLTESCVLASTATSRIQLSYQGEVLQRDMIVNVELLKCNGEPTDYYVYYVSNPDNGGRCGLMDANGQRLTAPVYSHIDAIGRSLFVCTLLDGITKEVKRF